MCQTAAKSWRPADYQPHPQSHSSNASGTRRATPSMITCEITSAISSDDTVVSSWLHWIAVPNIAQLTTRAIVSNGSPPPLSPPLAPFSHVQNTSRHSPLPPPSTHHPHNPP